MMELVAVLVSVVAFYISVMALLASHGRRDKRGAMVAETLDEDPRGDADVDYPESAMGTVQRKDGEGG